MNHFDYDRFRSLSGRALDDYMIPIANKRELRLNEQDLRRMLGELPDYDELHLVYAIEVGTRQLPNDFAPALPEFLAHASSSVRCAAVRNLEDLPMQSITEELIGAVMTGLERCPERKLVSYLPDTLRKRIRH